MKTAIVMGAGGFIGSHLVSRLKSEGYWVRGVDLKYPDFSTSEADEFLIYDLRDFKNVEAVMRLDATRCFSYLVKSFTIAEQFDEVYQLAADMGGCQYIFTGEHDSDIMLNSAAININLCVVLKDQKFKGKVFYSSSACMYPQQLQIAHDFSDNEISEGVPASTYALSEEMAYPGNPDSEYGWEKLFSERLYLAMSRNYNLNVRIARLHNIYGPSGTYEGGKEKAPASISRKVIKGELKMWGDGQQTRSFLFIDDCIDAVRLLVGSDFKEPINIGSEEMVTIKQLWEIAIKNRGYGELEMIEMPKGVMGVSGRNSDNTLIRKELNWEPKLTLEQGIEKTYQWIKSQVQTKNTHK